MKKSTLIALLGGCALVLTTQAALAFYDPIIVPSGHPGVRPAKAAQTAQAAQTTQDPQMSVAFAYLNKSGYAVQSLTRQSDGNYDAQIVGPDAKVKNVRVSLQPQEIRDAKGQKLTPSMPADEAISWLAQMGYTPQTFQVKEGQYVFAAYDKNGTAERITIDPATRNLSVVEINKLPGAQEDSKVAA